MINPQPNPTRFDANWHNSGKRAMALIFCVTIVLQIVAVNCTQLSSNSNATLEGFKLQNRKIILKDLKCNFDQRLNGFAEQLIELVPDFKPLPEDKKVAAKLPELVSMRANMKAKLIELFNGQKAIKAVEYSLTKGNRRPNTNEVITRMKKFLEKLNNDTPGAFDCFGMAWRLDGSGTNKVMNLLLFAGRTGTDPVVEFRPKTVHLPLKDNLTVPQAAAAGSSNHSDISVASAGKSSNNSLGEAAPTTPAKGPSSVLNKTYMRI